MDPEVRRFFRKIMATVGAGLLWIMLMAVGGLYFRLGYFVAGLDWYNGVFYFVFVATLILVLRFLYNLWRKKERP